MFFLLVISDSGGKMEMISAFAESDYNNLKKYCVVRLCTKGKYSFDAANDAAEKIVQDCFLLLCEKIRTVEINNIKAWMYRAADILIKKEIRLRAVDLRFLRDDDGTIEALRADEPQNDEGYDFIETLDRKDREKIELYYGKEKTLDEIANDMGIKSATLRKRKSRFEKDIKKRYEKYKKTQKMNA